MSRWAFRLRSGENALMPEKGSRSVQRYVRIYPPVPLLRVADRFGPGALAWYRQLKAADRARADQQAADYANERYGKPVWRLTAEEASDVNRVTRPNFHAA
jgi:hypothetical protein